MRSVNVFGPDGLWTGRTIRVPDQDIDANLGPGETALDQTEFPHALRLVDGQLVDFQPPQPSEDHAWSEEHRTWRIKPEVMARRMEIQATQKQIESLEKRQARAIREATLGQPGAVDRLQDIENQIVSLRTLLTKEPL